MIERVRRHFVAKLLWAAGAAVSPASAIGQASPTIAPRQLQVVDSLVAAELAKDSIGSITVGVIAGSQLAWTRSYGFADMKSRRPADRNTVYRIASVTKPFTAVMLMQLVEAGKLRLSDPVERFLPEVRKIRPAPRGAMPFTFLQLATMTAGLASQPDDEGQFFKGPVAECEKQMLAALPRTSYQTAPGTEYSYSNIGYSILGGALGRAAGQSYLDWQRMKILEPLGMKRTRFDVDSSIARDLAIGYEIRGDGTLDDSTAAKEIREGRGYKVPNGGIFTTVDDLARFVSFELGRGPASVLSRVGLDDAFGGLVATNEGLEQGYGLGFMAMRRGDDFFYAGHSGNFVGYQASMWFHRQMQLGVVLFRNVTGGRQEPDRLAVDILETLVSARRAAIQADINARFREQKASPGGEAALHRIIEEIRSGKPNYDLMGPSLARQMRRRLPEEQAAIVALGALTSVMFKSAGAGGANVFQATFEKGAQEWRVWFNPEGSVDFFTRRPN
jgi:CubicO group peptidase (beta-lactamase class C family)